MMGDWIDSPYGVFPVCELGSASHCRVTVPEGQPRIARRFNAGACDINGRVLKGWLRICFESHLQAKELRLGTGSAVPPGRRITSLLFSNPAAVVRCLEFEGPV